MSDKDQQFAVQVMSDTYNLYGGAFGSGVLNALTKTTDAVATSGGVTNTARPGIVKYQQPVCADAVYGLKDISGHHSSCIQAKKYATDGLGFIDEGDEIEEASGEEAIEKSQSLLSGQGHVESKVDKVLDPLTTFGFMNELLDETEDFMDVGTGYLEVHRDEAGKIDGLRQIPYKNLWPCTFDGRLFYQYNAPGGTTKYWAQFGKANREWLLSDKGPYKGSLKAEDVSEIIAFIQPSNRVKYYGYPDWISASVDIDLLKKSKQYKADFYHNRGVLDKVLVVSGEKVESDAWDQITASIKASIGEGNNFKSIAMNFQSADVKVEILNMGADGKTEEQFAKDNEVFTTNIVSSHGVPPLLANILIPGKLGASNEFINALVGFQLLRINAYQNVQEKTLAKTLGGVDGVEGLGPEDFRLRTITSQIDITGMETIGKMREEATGTDRDVSKGTKD